MTSVPAIFQAAPVPLSPVSPLTPLMSLSPPFQSANLTLDQLPKGAPAVITRIDANAEGGEISLRLMELGFVEGEILRVVAKGYFAGTPIAVRVGGTTFALRRFEAALISVLPLAPTVVDPPTQTTEPEIT